MRQEQLEKEFEANNTASSHEKLTENEIPPEENPQQDSYEEPQEEALETERAYILREYEEKEEEEDKKRFGLWIPRRNLMRAVRAVFRANRISLGIIGLITLCTILFTVSWFYEKTGNFTININRIEAINWGFELAEDINFNDPAPRLTAEAVSQATNISIDDLPYDIDKTDGKHNSKNYVAYTFYVRNGGRKVANYRTEIIIEMVAKNVDDAVRLMLFDKNGRTVYAKMGKDGEPEKGTTPFINKTLIMENLIEHFKPGDVDKYTAVIWLEGSDPECLDNLIGGMIRMRMNIDIEKPTKDNIFHDYVDEVITQS